MAEQALLPDPTSLHLVPIGTERNVITMVVRTTASEAKCSLCEKSSTKVHSRYTLRLHELLTLIGFADRAEKRARSAGGRYEAFDQPRYAAPDDPHGAGTLSCHASRARSGRFCVSPSKNLRHDPHRS